MPEQYGDYEVESFLGKGSIGKVFLARHRRIGRRVALKTVMLDQKFEDEQDQTEFHKRLQREAELCASMQHPNIVTLYDVGYEGDVVAWLATEYVDGESLLARLRRSHPLPLEEALSISADILRGLAYAHSKGIIHRDIKPANILLTSAGQAKIADFGVARPLHSSLTVTRSLVGTPNYMSPEQVKTSPVSTRSDLFSAGTLMYELLTGKRPFLGAELSAILYNVVNLTPPLASSAHQQVPEPVAKIVARLMEKRPEDRYPTAEEALADLTLIREGGKPQFADYTVGNDTIVANTDSTTPLPTVVDDNASTPALHRRIPAMLFWGVILGLIAALASSMTLALDHAEELKAPTGIITAEQQRTASEKALALESLRGLMDEGKFEEAVTGFDNFLARHPESVAARIERDEAQRLLEEAAPKSEITRTATTSSATKKKEPETPPSRWQRVKRWFRGN